MVNYLQQTYQPQGCPVLCAYLTSNETDAQTPENIYGSLLKQLLQQNPNEPIPNVLKETYIKKGKSSASKPSLGVLRRTFKEDIKNYLRVYLVIDGLDEASEATKRLIEREFPPLCADNLSLMVTSGIHDGMSKMIFCTHCGADNLKLYWNCELCPGRNAGQEFDMCEDCNDMGFKCRNQAHTLKEPDRVDLEIRARDEDLNAYVWWRIKEEVPKDVKSGDSRTFRDGRKYSGDSSKSRLYRKLTKAPALMEIIPKTIIQKAKGRFLLAKLYMDDFVKVRTTEEAKKMLDSFPDNWEDFYEKEMETKILGQEDKKDRALALKILSILACARRPLTLRELIHALGIEIGDTELNPDRDFDKEDILEVTKTLINVDDGDEETACVRFYHLTLQNYLYKTRARWFKSLETSSPEAEMAALCLTCLGYDSLATKSEAESKSGQQSEIETRVQENPFAAYALQFWGDHFQKDQADATAERLASELLQDPDRIQAYVQAAWWTGVQQMHSWDVHRDVDALHITAWFGLDLLTLRLVLEGHQVNAREGTYGQTPLMYACRNGHTEVVEQLLHIGADINATSENPSGVTGYTTPLLEAIKAHQEDVLDLLLKKTELAVNAVNAKFHNQTPLMAAIAFESPDLVPRLLERVDIDFNARDNNLSTALTLAAGQGALGVVRALLAKPGLEVDCMEASEGRTPLMLAAQYAETNVAEIIRELLKHGADPNLCDQLYKRTAICRAIEENGRTKPAQSMQAVQALLENGITDLKCVDSEGKGLLHYACEAGNAHILKLLIGKGLDVNLRDHGGLTPLHMVVQSGSDDAVEVTKILLESGADTKITDESGNTAHVYAALAHNTQLMETLNTEGIEAMIDDSKWDFPIYTLVQYGLQDKIAEGLAKGTLNITETEPGTGNSAVHIAVLKGHVEILRMLLDAGMDVDVIGQSNATPMHLAAMNGLMESFAVLKERDADINAVTAFGVTPLTLAERYGRWEAAVSLVEAGATINPTVNNVQRLFFAAVKLNNVKAAKILLDMRDGRPDPLAKNEEGFTGRDLARFTKNPDMVRLMDSAKSFSSRIAYINSQKSSFSSISSMPTPPTTFLPFRRTSTHTSVEVTEVMMEEPEEDENLNARLEALKM